MNIHKNSLIIVIILLSFLSFLFSTSNETIIQKTNNANQDSSLRYTVNNGPVHQWIALQAYYKLTDQNLINEISNYIPIDENSFYYSGDQQGIEFEPPEGWSLNTNAPFESASALIEGTWEEDKGEFLAAPEWLQDLIGGLPEIPLRSLFHFWDPDGDYNSGLNLELLDLGIQQSALTTAQSRFSQAIVQYNMGNLTNAYYWLGRTAHLLMDMSVPAHVQLDQHLFPSDNYEDFVGSWEFHYKHIDYSSPNTYLPTPPYAIYNGSTPEWFNEDLTNLFYSLANYADQFDSDDVDGESSLYGNGKYRLMNNSLDPDRTFVTAYKLSSFGTEARLLIEGTDYEIVVCNWSSDATIVYTDSFYNEIFLYPLEGVRVYYTDGSSTDYIDQDLYDVPWAVVGELFQSQLQARAIGYTAGIYQLFWSIVNPIVEDNYEENDDMPDAYDLSNYWNQWLHNVNGFGIHGDQDWYQIYVPSGAGCLSIECQFVHSEGDIDIRLYNSSGTIVDDSNSSSNDYELICYDDPTPGYYYVEVYQLPYNGNTYDLWWGSNCADQLIQTYPPNGYQFLECSADDENIVLDWEDDVYMDRYEVEVDNNPEFSSPCYYSDNDPEESFIYVCGECQDLVYEGTYYWRVRGRVKPPCNMWGEWSDTRSFVVGCNDLAIDEETLYPQNGDNGGLSVTFNWADVENSAGYEIQIDITSTEFENIWNSEIIFVSEFPQVFPHEINTVYWRVRPLSFSGCEDGQWTESFLYLTNETAGCTDPEAINYCEECTLDDGSCEYGVDPSLISYYPFSGNANDESGNGNDGIVVGAVLTSDRFENENSAYSFDGIDDYITSPITKPENQAFTVNVWAKGSGSMSSFKTPEYESYLGYELNMCFFHMGWWVSDIVIDADLTDFGDLSEEFSMFTIMVFPIGDDSSQGQIYLNTILVGELVITYSIPSWQYMEIGRNVVEHNGHYNGIIDDIQIYDRVLLESELDSLYHVGDWDSEQENGLIAYYPFNESVIDESGNEYNGTVVGVDLTDDRFGILNSAGDFDGNSYINTNIGTGENYFSLSLNAWVKSKNIDGGFGSEVGTVNFVGIFGPTAGVFRIGSWSGDIGSAFFEIQTDIFYSNRIDDGQWHMLSMTYSDSLWKLYIDGNIIYSDTEPPPISSNNNFCIGARHDEDWTEYDEFADAYIDDVSIYNRVLTTSEIDSLYHIGGWPVATVGCTDPDAINYCEDCTVDDGSCIYNGTVTDIEGNVYSTIVIGNQEWMSENLRVTHYANGDEIPTGYSNSEWMNLQIGAFAEYDNNPDHADTYGKLYNWYVVNDSRGIAPEGWRVPTDEEFMELEMYLGMSPTEVEGVDEYRGTDEGGKLKELGTNHWNTPNEGATNESGFTALPGGYRFSDTGMYHYLGDYCSLWSQTEIDIDNSMNRELGYAQSGIARYVAFKQYGSSIRLIRDIVEISGCTDEEAMNYCEECTEDDGSCEYEITAGLVAYYPFNGNANDESGNGNHGIEQGDISQTTDRFGVESSAYLFDGVDDFLLITDWIHLANSVSFSFWLKPSDIQIMGIISKREPWSNDWQLDFNDENEQENGFRALLWGTNNEVHPTEIDFLTIDEWIHVGVVYNGSDVRIYKNNNLMYTENNSGSINDRDYDIRIGDDWWGNYFNGIIDDILIYNRAISEFEIDSLYHIGGWPVATVGCTDPDAINYCEECTVDDGSCIYNGSVTDIEGNVYSTVIIGNQEWMAENLKVTHYRDGDPISTENYSFYNDDQINFEKYGNLYDWHAVDDERNIAPEGWHIPSDSEWLELITYLGGEGVAGGKLKQEGFDNWIEPNTGATNESGFTALPGGYWYSGHNNLGYDAYFWTSVEYSSSYAWRVRLFHDRSEVTQLQDHMGHGFSIRCVKDNIESISGCTDPLAINYNPDATIDDGSCEYDVVSIFFGSIDYYNQTVEVLMSNPEPVYGFQFVVDNITNDFQLAGSNGGRADEAGFDVSTGGDNLVLGFSFSGDFIPTGEGALTYLSYDDFFTEEICFSDALFSAGPGEPEHSLSFGPCLEPVLIGDANLDGEINVVDIVTIVGIIFGDIDPDSTQFIAADVNGSGGINVQDIVDLIPVIIGDNMAKGVPVTHSDVHISNNQVMLSADGTPAGIQFEVSGRFDVELSTVTLGWELHRNENTILMYSLNASHLTSAALFEFNGDLEIHSALVADWFGNGINADIRIIPGHFTLQPAYPNPFNPETTITYSLPLDASVSLIVYDITGRMVSEMVAPNTYMSAGSYSNEFSGRDLSNGIYFVILKANTGNEEFVSKQKVVLLK